ncbi:hypothetical protein MO767_13875 [Pseudomonas sp. UYIF39]|uniref:hypothetical protein n=1 Tax=Pseudomonas sp. UYIF39 TaxID=1630747 RepID=UPI00249E7BA3|nr:hypothetical protein [Pseudomonas sp. UYIF39]MDI3355432.1 hypothetical protein [Pseudomonas sp. UYIF39]
MGCKNYFAEHHPHTKVIAVDTVGSVTFGLPGETRHMPGLGTSRLPEIFEPSGIHDFLSIHEEQTIKVCRWLAGWRNATVCSSAAPPALSSRVSSNGRRTFVPTMSLWRSHGTWVSATSKPSIPTTGFPSASAQQRCIHFSQKSLWHFRRNSQ